MLFFRVLPGILSYAIGFKVLSKVVQHNSHQLPVSSEDLSIVSVMKELDFVVCLILMN